MDAIEYTFPNATVGYGARTPKNITITNLGNQPTGVLTISLFGDTTAFTLSRSSILSIPVGASMTLTATPVTGLAPGTYSATVMVVGSNRLSGIQNLCFTVQNNTGGSGGAGGAGGAGGVGSGTNSGAPSQGSDSSTLIPGSQTPLSGVPLLSNNPFEDIREVDWFYDHVVYIYTRGIMLGTSASPALFSPNSGLTRSMFITILYRVANSPNVTGLPNVFRDVEAEEWYTDAIKWAAINAIIYGYGNDRFGPEDEITREQMAAVLLRYANFAALQLPVTRGRPSFTDMGTTSEYAQEAVNRLFTAGILDGRSGTDFAPRGQATRAEAAAMLTRFIEATT